MCKDFKEEEIKEELYTSEEVQELIESVAPIIKVDTQLCENISLDVNEFAKGVRSVSVICGKFSALKSVGLTSAEAIDIIVNQDNIAFNLQLNNDTAKSNIEVAKCQCVQVQQSGV